MTINPFLVKNVTRTYDRQLENARRIARLNQYMKKAGQTDSVTISKEAKRKQIVERVSREIVNNLIGSDSKNPVVQQIKQQVQAEFNTEMTFSYSPEGEGLQILKKGNKKLTEKVTNKERERIITRLWEITLEKVDSTML